MYIVFRKYDCKPQNEYLCLRTLNLAINERKKVLQILTMRIPNRNGNITINV